MNGSISYTIYISLPIWEPKPSNFLLSNLFTFLHSPSLSFLFPSIVPSSLLLLFYFTYFRENDNENNLYGPDRGRKNFTYYVSFLFFFSLPLLVMIIYFFFFFFFLYSSSSSFYFTSLAMPMIRQQTYFYTKTLFFTHCLWCRTKSFSCFSFRVNKFIYKMFFKKMRKKEKEC